MGCGRRAAEHGTLSSGRRTEEVAPSPPLVPLLDRHQCRWSGPVQTSTNKGRQLARRLPRSAGRHALTTPAAAFHAERSPSVGESPDVRRRRCWSGRCRRQIWATRQGIHYLYPSGGGSARMSCTHPVQNIYSRISGVRTRANRTLTGPGRLITSMYTHALS